jgi:hypothetical protein
MPGFGVLQSNCIDEEWRTVDENSSACYQPPECRFTILYGNGATIFAQDDNVISVQSVPGKIA